MEIYSDKLKIYLIDKNHKILKPEKKQKCYQYIHKKDTPCPECPFKTKKFSFKIHTKEGTKKIETEQKEDYLIEKITKLNDTQNLLLTNIAKHSMDAIISFGTNTKITFWNKGAKKLFGYSKEEVIGKSFKILCLKEDYKRVEESLEKAKETGFRVAKTRRLSKKGKIIPVLKTITALKDKEGKLIGFSSILKDITLEEKAEKILKQSKELIETKVEERTKELEKSEFEKSQLLKKLEKYTNILELKLTGIEKKRLGLSQKEKETLYGLLRYPNYSDEKISEKIAIKRSTITSIKNRLIKEGWIKKTSTPHPQRIGFNTLMIIIGELKEETKLSEKTYNLIEQESDIFISTQELFLTISFHKNQTVAETKQIEIEKEIKDIGTIRGKKICKENLKLSTLTKFLEWSKGISAQLNIEEKEKIRPLKNKKPIKLSKNKWNILKTKIKDPKLTTKEIGIKLGLSNPTVSNAIHLFIKNRIIANTYTPNFIKIGFPKLIITRIGFPPQQKETVFTLKKKVSNQIIEVIGENHIFMVCVIDNKKHRKENFKEFLKALEKKEIIDIIQKVIPTEDITRFSAEFNNITKVFQ